MNNLNPEPRADINGKVTTRWVRHTASTSTKALLSSPLLPPVPELQPETAESAPLLAGVMEQVFPKRALMRVDDLHPLAAQRIEAMLEEAKKEAGSVVIPNPFGFVQGALLTTLFEVRDKMFAQGVSARNRPINEFAVFGPDNSGHDLEHLLAGLRKRREFRHVNDFLLDLPSKGLERAIALYKVTSSVGTRHLEMHLHDEEDKDGYTVEELDEYVMLMSDDLANFVMDNPELADDVIRVIRERKSSDADMIREVLNGDTPALGSGVL
jgi:hypothetical protein